MDTSDIVKADSGYASRKFWFSIGIVGAIFLAAVLCGLWPALIPMFPEMVGGFLAVLALYVTGNVSSKWVIGKTNPGISFAGEQWQEKVAAKVVEKLQPKAPTPPADKPANDHVDPKDEGGES